MTQRPTTTVANASPRSTGLTTAAAFLGAGAAAGAGLAAAGAAGAGAWARGAGAAGAGAGAGAAGADGAAAAVAAAGAGAGAAGILIAGPPAGFGGRLMRTVCFFCAASAGLGGSGDGGVEDPGGGVSDMMIWKYLVRLGMGMPRSQNIVPDVLTHGHPASPHGLHARRDHPSPRDLPGHHGPENHDCRHHDLRPLHSRHADGLPEAAPPGDGQC